MRALIQRVSHAEVTVAGERVGAINRGVLALIGVETADDVPDAARLLERVLTFRIFPDGDGRMNLSLEQIEGGLLLVPQFTLAADTRKGTRAGFSTAAPPERSRALFDHLAELAQRRHGALGRPLAFGRFGADMQVSLTNDGPVTFLLQVT
ncbi:MAG: D-aminoacyl-tRNA deacylase [Steroidobacteraceae bacterium]